MLRSVIRTGLSLADDFFVALGPKARPGDGSLSAVLFHSLYRNKSELRDSALAPNQGVTVEDFRSFVGVVLESGYRVVSSEGAEYYLQQRFGRSVLQPQSDLDRPFTAGELRDFARHKWVRLGNHTRDHAILTNYCRSEIGRQVQECQKELTQIAGYAPIAIAYPNGNFCEAAIDAAMEAGLRIGLTVRPSRNPLPLESARSRMTLGRFLFWGGRDARDQCRKFGSSFVPSNALRTLIYSKY